MTLLTDYRKGEKHFLKPEMEFLCLPPQETLTASTDPEPEDPVKKPLKEELPEFPV